jgi:hypothetical protein
MRVGKAPILALALACAFVSARLVRADGLRIEVTASTIDASVGDHVTIDAKLLQGESPVKGEQTWLWLVPEDSGLLRDGERTSEPTNVYTPNIPGTHKIKVSTRAAMNEGVWGEVLIAVRDRPAGAVRVDPDRPHDHAFFVSPTDVTMRVGETVRFDYTGCSCLDVSGRVQWNVPAGVKLSAERQLTAVSPGLHKVRVVSNNITRWLTIRVSPPGPRCARIELLPANAIVSAGTSLPFQATCLDERGTPIKVALAWSSSGGSVDGDGKFAAGDLPGRFQVLCRDAETGVSAVVWVVVDSAPRPIASIFLGPRYTRCSPGQYVQLGCRAYDAENNEVPCPPVAFTASAGSVDAQARYHAPAEAAGKHVTVHVTEPKSGKTDQVDVYVVK